MRRKELKVKTMIEQFSYDLEMKTRGQNRNNKRTKIERFDWFMERIQPRVAFGWSSERLACVADALNLLYIASAN